MKILLIVFFNCLALVSHATGIQKSKLHYPVIPNAVNDKFIAANEEKIEGLLGYRLKVNLE